MAGTPQYFVPVRRAPQLRRLYILLLVGLACVVAGAITLGVVLSQNSDERSASSLTQQTPSAPRQNTAYPVGLNHTDAVTAPLADDTPGADVGVIGIIPLCAAIALRSDRYGNDINKGNTTAEAAATLEACFSKCMAAPLCQFFAWKLNRQCWLKDAAAVNVPLTVLEDTTLVDVRACRDASATDAGPTEPAAAEAKAPPTPAPAPPLAAPTGNTPYVPGADYVPMMDPFAPIGAAGAAKCGLSIVLSACGRECASDADCDASLGETCHPPDPSVTVASCITDCRDDTGTNFYLIDSEHGPPEESAVPPGTVLTYPPRMGGPVDSCITPGAAWTQTHWTFRMLLQLAPGKCQICPDARCELYWPDKDGFYKDDCTGTFATSTGLLEVQMDTSGDEVASNTGGDKYMHYHYQCCCGEDNCVYNKVYQTPDALAGLRANGKPPQPIKLSHIGSGYNPVDSPLFQMQYDIIMQLRNPADLSGYLRYSRTHPFYMNPHYRPPSSTVATQ